MTDNGSQHKPNQEPRIELEVIVEPESDPIAQERVELERTLFGADSNSSAYHKAVTRIRELNDQFTAEPGSLHELTNEQLFERIDDGSTPVGLDQIVEILRSRSEGGKFPPRSKK